MVHAGGVLKRILRPRENKPLRDQFRYYLLLAILAVVVLGVLANLWDRLETE